VSNAPRAWVTISGQTPAGAAFAKNGEESLRTVYFDPAFARVTVDTSVNPPRVVVSLSPDNTGVELSSATPLAIGTAAAGNGTEASAWNHVHAHGNQLGGSLHADASGAAAGFMTAAQFSKLGAIEAGADVTDFGNVSAALSAASGNVSINSVRITNVANPIDDQDADTKGARSAAIAAVASRSLYFGTFSSSNSATPAYLDTGANVRNTLSATEYFYPIDAATTITSIAIGQKPGSNTAIHRFEFYLSAGGAAFAATGRYIDIAVTDYSELQVLASPLVLAAGDRVGLTAKLLSGSIGSAATQCVAKVNYT
jgi:hypothetical protein